MGFAIPAGDVIAALRSEKGFTQQGLATRATVSIKTVERAERGERMRAERLSHIAAALEVQLADLVAPQISVRDAREIAEEFTCKHCGAKLADRVPVEHQYGYDDLDRYECGAETGWHDRPCPKDPRFPALEDYELRTYEDGDRFFCHAVGKTDMAHAVQLDQGFGKTKESAEKWVQRSYIWMRDGREAAEKFLPFHLHE
jgi:transcriptional regulator with XRE-family HTH domain